MNPKVEEFLAKEKARVLISAGLFEPEREYSARYTSQYSIYDAKMKQYYRIKKNPIEVTDEEYAEILKYAKAPRNDKPKEEIRDIEIQREKPQNNGAEKTLNSIAKFTLTCGIIEAILVLFCFLFGADMDLAPFGLVMAIGLVVALLVLVQSAALWSIMRVFVNMSFTLKDINSQCKK